MTRIPHGKRPWQLWSVTAACGLMVYSWAPPLEAQSDRRLTWDPAWRRVGAPEYAVTGAMFVGAAAFELWVPPAESALWTRRGSFDREARRFIVAESQRGRKVAAITSDSLALASIAQPVIVDALLVTAVGDQNTDVAWQLEVISLQSYGVSLFANTVAKRLFARERPYGVMCAIDSEYTHCDSLDRFRSFYSGHSAITATSAGLTCAHHTHLPIYGSALADGAACATATLSMFATGLLRMRADMHWATDVLVGHALGFAAGFLLPSLVYYKGFNRRAESSSVTAAAPAPNLVVGGEF